MGKFVTALAVVWLIVGIPLAIALARISQSERNSDDERGFCSALTVLCFLSEMPTIAWLLARYLPRVF